MDLRSLSDDALIVRTKESVRAERGATTTVLHDLREIERRMLFAKNGCSTLKEYAMKEFKYSDSAAYRRVSAMQLLKEMPEIEPKIETGGLSLSTLAQAQTHFDQAKTVSVEEKRAVLQEIENLSARVCQRVLAEKRGETEPPEKRKALAGGKTQVAFVLDGEAEALLKDVQIELGRTLKMKVLVKEMAKLSLQVLRKRKSTPQTSRDTKASNVDGRQSARKGSVSRESPSGAAPEASASASAEKSDRKNADINVNSSVSKEASKAAPTPPTSAAQSNNISLDTGNARMQIHSVSSGNSESIPLPTRRAVWRRDQGRCQYRDPLKGRQCECTTYLQVEHIVPRAHGGSNELENLELLCRTHNTYRAVQMFGPKHMQQFVTSLR